MIELFFFPSPNGIKVVIMLEECGFDYRVTPWERWWCIFRESVTASLLPDMEG